MTTRMPVTFLFLALAWFVIAEGRPDVLWGGLVAVPLAWLLRRRLQSPTAHAGLRMARLPGFLGYFLGRSLLAGVAVAGLALQRRPALRPVLLRWPLRLPPGARELFLSTVSLLPGTLSAQLEGDVLLVHALDAGGAEASLAEAEQRVALLFGIEPGVPS